MAKKNWRNLDMKSIAKRAGKKTDEDLAAKILDLRAPTEEEIKAFFPTKTDREAVTELLKIVKSAEDRNTKITRIMENSEKFVGVMTKLVGKVI